MTPYLVLFFAALSRFVPHWTHTVGVGITAAGAGLIFFGSRLSERSRWQVVPAILLYAIADFCLTTYAYNYPFHPTGYVVTWMWNAAVVLFASYVLSSRRTVLRVAGTALFSSTGFFFVTNTAAWWRNDFYPQTLHGLGLSLAAGVPFYRNDVLSTLICCGVLFGVPALVHGMQQERAMYSR